MARLITLALLLALALIGLQAQDTQDGMETDSKLDVYNDLMKDFSDDDEQEEDETEVEDEELKESGHPRAGVRHGYGWELDRKNGGIDYRTSRGIRIKPDVRIRDKEVGVRVSIPFGKKR